MFRSLQTTSANVEYDFSKDQWYKRSSFKVSNKIKNILNEGKTIRINTCPYFFFLMI